MAATVKNYGQNEKASIDEIKIKEKLYLYNGINIQNIYGGPLEYETSEPKIFLDFDERFEVLYHIEGKYFIDPYIQLWDTEITDISCTSKKPEKIITSSNSGLSFDIFPKSNISGMKYEFNFKNYNNDAVVTVFNSAIYGEKTFNLTNYFKAFTLGGTQGKYINFQQANIYLDGKKNYHIIIFYQAPMPASVGYNDTIYGALYIQCKPML